MKHNFIPFIATLFVVIISNAGGWYKLGTLSLPQQGNDAEIRIVSGNGFNASFTQQGESVIHFRTSNGISQIGGFYGSGVFYCTGRIKIITGIRIIQLSPNSWAVYANLVGYTGEGAIVNFSSVNGTWTNEFLFVGSAPNTIPYLDLTDELVQHSDVFIMGKTGIGTASPDEMLTVNGKIHAKEVRIDTFGTPPDYVFDDDYKLLSLLETERYIKTNNHLPDIPSGRDMQRNGVNVNEMQMMLLRKVEELSLYLIEKEKQILKQEQKTNSLEGNVEHLNRLLKIKRKKL
jgi:hypothetical protein